VTARSGRVRELGRRTDPCRDFARRFATIWRLAYPYFYSHRPCGCVPLAAVLAIECASIGINVLINQCNTHSANAIQERNRDVFV
jgi:hypothetical protein